MEHQNHSKKERLPSIEEEDTFLEQISSEHEEEPLEVIQQLGSSMHGESAFEVYAPKVQRELVFTSVT